MIPNVIRTAGILVALASLSCAPESGIDPDPPCEAIRVSGRPQDVNVILIVNDTMRRDRLGVYGGSAATPVFDEFAREHLYFDRAFSNAPWTKPSIATLFTSTYPSQHRLASHPELRARMRNLRNTGVLGEVDVLSDGYTTLAEVLRNAGYRTAGFVVNPWMGKEFGFAQGFEVYDDSFARWDVEGQVVSLAALRWLETLDPGEKFFLYLHYIDSHQPYGVLTDADVQNNTRLLARGTAPRGAEARPMFEWLAHHQQQRLSAESLARLEWLGPSVAFFNMVYDRGVEDFDRSLGVFLDGFAAHPAYDRTAVLITSDHGEALFDRGYGNHGLGLQDDEIAIPLAAKLPGARVRDPKVDCTVELIDLLPTLCGYLEIDCPAPLFGRDILHDGAARYAVSEGVMLKPRHRAIRNRNYLLLWEPDGPPSQRKREYALFDLVRDPPATRDLLSAKSVTPETQGIADALAARLGAAIPPFDAPQSELAPLDPALEERLRALGYVD